jgi:hypothetical protein
MSCFKGAVQYNPVTENPTVRLRKNCLRGRLFTNIAPRTIMRPFESASTQPRYFVIPESSLSWGVRCFATKIPATAAWRLTGTRCGPGRPGGLPCRRHKATIPIRSRKQTTRRPKLRSIRPSRPAEIRAQSHMGAKNAGQAQWFLFTRPQRTRNLLCCYGHQSFREESKDLSKRNFRMSTLARVSSKAQNP